MLYRFGLPWIWQWHLNLSSIHIHTGLVQDDGCCHLLDLSILYVFGCYCPKCSSIVGNVIAPSSRRSTSYSVPMVVIQLFWWPISSVSFLHCDMLFPFRFLSFSSFRLHVPCLVVLAITVLQQFLSFSSSSSSYAMSGSVGDHGPPGIALIYSCQ